MQSASAHIEKNDSIFSQHISKIFSLGYTRMKFQEVQQQNKNNQAERGSVLKNIKYNYYFPRSFLFSCMLFWNIILF